MPVVSITIRTNDNTHHLICKGKDPALIKQYLLDIEEDINSESSSDLFETIIALLLTQGIIEEGPEEQLDIDVKDY